MKGDNRMLDVLENSFISFFSKHEVEKYMLEPFDEEFYEAIITLEIHGTNHFAARYMLYTKDEEFVYEGVIICNGENREKALLLTENKILELIKDHKSSK